MELESPEELANAVSALIDWLESQELEPRDSLRVLGCTIGAIFRGYPGTKRQRRTEMRFFMAKLRTSLPFIEDVEP